MSYILAIRQGDKCFGEDFYYCEESVFKTLDAAREEATQILDDLGDYPTTTIEIYHIDDTPVMSVYHDINDEVLFEEICMECAHLVNNVCNKKNCALFK